MPESSKINEQNTLIKSVILSAYGDLENIRVAMNRGAFDFITKPINFEDLEITIEKTIKQVNQMKVTMEAIKQNNLLKMYVDETVLNFMGGREFEAIMAGQHATPTANDRAQVLARNVSLLPAVEPESGPFAGRQMAWTTEPETPGQRLVALSWYLASMTDTCLSLVGAELIVASSGMGNLIVRAQSALATDTVMAGMIAIGMVGVVIDVLIRKLERVLLKHRNA